MKRARPVGRPRKPKPPKGKTCGAKTKGGGTPCKRRDLGTGGRCRLHGGATPSGAASPHWRTGRWSKYLPAGVLDRFQEGLADPELMKIRQDVALVDAMLTGLTTKLPANRNPAERDERRILNLVDHRRRLIEAESRRLQGLQQTVTLAQFMGIMKVVADLFREFVVDPADRQEVQRRLGRLLVASNGGGGTVEHGGGDGD